MDFLQYLRMENLFNPNRRPVEDDPQNGGITGHLPPDTGIEDLGQNKHIFNPELINSNIPDRYADDTPLPSIRTGAPQDNTPNDGVDIGARMQELYNPEHDLIDRYKTMLETMPHREHVSGWRRLGAAIVGGLSQDPKIGDYLANKKYYDSMRDWKEGLEPLSKGAELERRSNDNMRTLANNVLTQEMGDRRLNVQSKNYADRNAIAQQRAATSKYRAEHPHHVYKEDSQGRIVAINPETNEAEYLMDDSGQPVISSNLPEEEKLNLKLEHDLTKIGASGVETRKNTTLRGTIESGHISQRGDEARQTQSERPTSTGKNGNSELEVQRGAANKARQLLNEHPEYSQFIKLDPKGNPTVKPAGKVDTKFGYGGTDFNKETRQQIMDYIYGPTSTTTITNEKPKDTPNPKPKVIPAKSKEIVMVAPDGRHVSVPADKVDEAIRRGAKKVQ